MKLKRTRTTFILLLTLIMVLQGMVLGLTAFAAGTNLPNITEYGLYDYIDSNEVSPSAIGSVIITGCDGVTYVQPPWPTLTDVPYVFENNVVIGIKFAVNVATPNYYNDNITKFHMYDSYNNEVAINVKRAGDGTNTDKNRNYLYVTPQVPLQPSSNYKIIVDSDITANNTQKAGKQQEVNFTTTADTTTAPVLTAGDASGAPGAVIQVPVNLTSSGEVVAIQFDLSYDPALLTYQQTSAGNLTSAFTVSANKIAGNKIRVIIYNDSNTPVVAGSGTVAQLQFQVAATATAGQTCLLGLSEVILSDSQSKAIITTVHNGQFTVPPDTTLNLSKNTAAVGETVTASGTAAPNAWIPLKVVDAAQSILVFDTTKADASGNYSIDFIVPVGATGTLTVVAGEGSKVDTKTLTVTATPPVDTVAPTWTGGSLTASAVSQTGLTLTWSAASDNVGVTGYKVYQNGVVIDTVSGTTLTYNVTGLSAATSYTFKVEAGDAVGNWSTDGPSVTVSTETETPPDTTAPVWTDGSLTASNVSQNGLTLTWSAASDNVGVTGYKVYQNGVVIDTVSGTTLTYNVTDLSAATSFTFKVEAGDAVGNWSTDGPSVTVSTETETPPDTTAPVWTDGSLTASAVSQTGLTLTWSAASDNVGVTGYKVYQNEVVIETVSGATLTCNVTGLSAATSFTFKVEAGDAAGNWSTNGPCVTVSTETETPPDTTAPVWTDGSLTTSAVSQTGLTLNWSAASDNVGVTGYKVYQNGVVIETVSGTTLTCNVTGLSTATSYTFKVEAGDAAGNWSTDGPNTNVTTKMEVVTKPSARPAGGAVVSGAEVTLTTTTTGATVYYTVDGSDPTAQSTAYTGPITISEPVTIKAIAVKAGMSDSAVLTVSYTIAVPIAAPEVTVPDDGSNKDLAITQDTLNLEVPVKITVPSAVKDATVSVTALMNDPDPETGLVTTGALPALNIAAGTDISATAPVQLDIPAGATVSAPADWNGTINVPRVQENNTVQVTPDTGMTATVHTVIEVGFGDVPLTFSKAVRILIPGQAGKDAGYYRNNQFYKINCLPGTQDNQEWADKNIPDGGDCKLDVGSDLVIWTKHFTKFATYTQTATPSGGGGGGGPTLQPVTSTTGAATVTPSAGGAISLRSEATIEVPANALTGTGAVEVKVQKVTTPPAVPTGFKLAGSVYEFSVGGKSSYNFAKKVTIKLNFDSSALNPGETPAIHYYDEILGQWVNIGGTVSGNTITVQVDHFTKFAVMAALKDEEQKTVALTDITGHWACNNINKLVDLGAISGYPDGSFKPDNTITRAEFATVLVKAFQLASQDGKTFTDTTGHWARDYIAAAAVNGVVNGYDTGTFGPDDLITREQMAVMIVRAAKLSPVSGEPQFTDSGSIAGWAKEAITTATQNGIMKGYPDHTVRPQGHATRAEAVTVIVNALSK